MTGRHNSGRLTLIGPIWLAGAALLLASCSFLHSSLPMSETLRPGPAPVPAALNLVQLNFGQQAEFGLCAPPACPSITPKTLATASSAAPLPPIHPANPVPAAPAEPASKAFDPAPDSPTLAATPTKPKASSPSKAVTVYFEFGQASLTQAAQAVLLGAMVGATDASRITVLGRTDNTGPAEANNSLAAARARTVKDFLRALYPRVGEILMGETRGACCYVAPNDSTQGRRLNRRVEVVIGGDERAEP